MKDNSRVVLVTGGAQGIGRGLVRHFAERGWRVVFVDRDEDAAIDTAKSFDGVRQHCGDVTDESFALRVIEDCRATCGRIDALINNAGVSSFVSIDEMSLEQFRRVIEINLVAYYAWAKAAVGALRESKGSIVNIASTRAIQSEPHGEAYAASKGGVVGLTHALAISLGPDVRVNCISPGWIEVGPWQKPEKRREPDHSDADRAQHPVGRVGRVEDVAHLAEFLSDERSGFITGQNYVVDGGMTRKMIYV